MSELSDDLIKQVDKQVPDLKRLDPKIYATKI